MHYCSLRNLLGIYSILSVVAPQVVKMALDVHSSEMAGDILVFLTGKCPQLLTSETLTLTKFATLIAVCLTGQSEIERACDLLFEKAEAIDYRYDVQDQTVEGLLILPLYGSMPTGKHVKQLPSFIVKYILTVCETMSPLLLHHRSTEADLSATTSRN